MRKHSHHDCKQSKSVPVLVVTFIGWALIVSIIGAIAQSIYQAKPIPEKIYELCLVLAGGIVALLAKTNVDNHPAGTTENPVNTTVVNPASDPIPVAQTPAPKTHKANSGD